MENFICYALLFILSWYIGWLIPSIYLYICSWCDWVETIEDAQIRKLRWIPIINISFIILAIVLFLVIIYMVFSNGVQWLIDKIYARRN